MLRRRNHVIAETHVERRIKAVQLAGQVREVATVDANHDEYAGNDAIIVGVPIPLNVNADSTPS
jgi:hypothetical protein